MICSTMTGHSTEFIFYFITYVIVLPNFNEVKSFELKSLNLHKHVTLMKPQSSAFFSLRVKRVKSQKMECKIRSFLSHCRKTSCAARSSSRASQRKTHFVCFALLFTSKWKDTFQRSPVIFFCYLVEAKSKKKTTKVVGKVIMNDCIQMGFKKIRKV